VGGASLAARDQASPLPVGARQPVRSLRVGPPPEACQASCRAWSPAVATRQKQIRAPSPHRASAGVVGQGGAIAELSAGRRFTLGEGQQLGATSASGPQLARVSLVASRQQTALTRASGALRLASPAGLRRVPWRTVDGVIKAEARPIALGAGPAQLIGGGRRIRARQGGIPCHRINVWITCVEHW